MRAPQRRDVQLFHLHQRAHGAFGFVAVGVHQHLRQRRRHDLPGEAVFILELAAAACFAAFRQLAPEIVDLGLRLAAYLQRECLGEFEMRPAIERDQRLPLSISNSTVTTDAACMP
jgi:hypothetical protein